jgi:hypothetical protein
VAEKHRRFKRFILPSPPVPPRPPAPSVPVPVRGERRHVLRATPDGEIFWAGWNDVQAAITEKVIRQKIETDGNLKP